MKSKITFWVFDITLNVTVLPYGIASTMNVFRTGKLILKM